MEEDDDQINTSVGNDGWVITIFVNDIHIRGKIRSRQCCTKFGLVKANTLVVALLIFHELCKRFRQNSLAGGQATNILDSRRKLPWAYFTLTINVPVT